MTLVEKVALTSIECDWLTKLNQSGEIRFGSKSGSSSVPVCSWDLLPRVKDCGRGDVQLFPEHDGEAKRFVPSDVLGAISETHHGVKKKLLWQQTSIYISCHKSRLNS